MEAKEVRSLMEAYASVYEGYGKKKKGDCVSKSEKGDHNCAKKVCHEEYGEGETIFGQHAVPDENGFVSHYNVQFEHGIVEDVSVEELDVLTMEAHNEHVEHQEDTISEMGGIMKAIGKVAKKVIGPADQSPEAEAARVGKRRPQTAQEKGVAAGTVNNEDADLYDLIKGHLIDEGFAETEEAAHCIMANMSEEWRNGIVEQYRAGFRSDGRYQNADGSTTGPVMGAIKSILSGNLPKSRTVIPPTPQPSVTVTQTRNPTKKTPYSKGEDGKLTDFGAGGGDEKMRRTGMSVAEVEKLGRKNKGAKGPKPYEQGGPRLPGRDM